MLLVLGGSAAIALRERPFRAPDAPVVATVAAPRAPDTATPPENLLKPASPTGPSIIKVDPPANGGSIIVRNPSEIGQNLRVAHLPDRSLVEDTPDGPLPVRAGDGRRAFDVYARPWSGARGARVAIVIGGLAVSQTGTQAAIDRLPPEVTLAFASGGNSIDRWMQTARRKGHEILLQVPMEPFDYPAVDPGRNTLTVDAQTGQNIDRLHWALARTTNYTGIINYMGGRYVTDRSAMTGMLDELSRRGLMYVDDGSTARSLAGELSKATRTPFAAADATIDAKRERGDILRKLDEIERTARAKGTAIAVGSAFDQTIEAVSGWVTEARKRGIEIVPVSALAYDPERG